MRGGRRGREKKKKGGSKGKTKQSEGERIHYCRHLAICAKKVISNETAGKKPGTTEWPLGEKGKKLSQQKRENYRLKKGGRRRPHSCGGEGGMVSLPDQKCAQNSQQRGT